MDNLFFDIESTVDTDRLPLFAEDLDAKAWDAVGKEMDLPAGVAANPDELAALHKEKVGLLGATTPEYLRIIGMNLGVDEEAPRSGWAGEVREASGVVLTERDLLEAFWTYAAKVKHVVGFNCNRFDLPAIYVRSALLGIAPTVAFYDQKPWNFGVIDLMDARWPRRAGAQFQSLKALRRVLQLPVPEAYADLLDMTGADVGALWSAGEFEQCRRYGELDIWTTRELCRWGGGFFWPQILERNA